MTNIESFLTPPLDSQYTAKMMEYYREAKKLHYLKKYASAITTFGKFLELTAEAICNYMNLGKCDAGCGQVVQRIIDSPYPNKSLKLYIPRAIQAAFTIRNGRDAAHGTANMNTSPYDSEYVASVCDWILGELIVELSNQDLQSVRGMLETITVKKAPIIFENSDGDLVILTNRILVKEEILLILYFRNAPSTVRMLADRSKRSVATIRMELGRMESRKYVSKLKNGTYELLPPGILKAEEVIHRFSGN